ncbi:MAG: hypothetical protein ACR2GY_03750 [Phycisphaerales bacterium]
MNDVASVIRPAADGADQYRFTSQQRIAVRDSHTFERALQSAVDDAPGDRAAISPERIAKAHEAAEQFIGMAFIQPMLAELRSGTFAVEPFAATAVEEQFGPMLDAILSDRIMSATHFPLTDRIANQLLGGSGQP